MISIRTVVTAASLAGVTLACSPDGPRAAGKIPVTTSSRKALVLYLEGRALAERQRHAEARIRFAKAAALDPGFALAHLGLAATASTSAEVYKATSQAVERASAVSPGEAHLIRAFEAAVEGRPEEQRNHLQALVESFPGDERAQYGLGAFHYRRQEWPQAIDRLERAIAIDPSFAPAYNLLGYCLRNLQRFGEAESALARYTQLAPDEPNPYDSYGELLMKMGRFADSLAQYRKALDLDPNFTASYIGVGNDLVFLGRFQEARNAFTKLSFIARSDLDRRNALTWTAISFIHEGRTDAALDALLRSYALARAAGDHVAMAADLSTMSAVLLEDGRGDAAVERYGEALAAVENAKLADGVREYYRRGSLYVEARRALTCGDLVTAVGAAERLRDSVVGGENPGELRASHELLGRVALALDDHEAAIRELRQADRQDPGVLFLEAKALLAAGRPEEAREACARAADFNGLGLSYAFVRSKAQRLLAELEKGASP